MDLKDRVCEVPSDPKTLSQLMDSFEPGLPKTNFIRMCVRNMKDGRINARLYSDGWPEFTTLVCQIFYPSSSEVADIVPYSTSKERLVHVLMEAQLITWGKEQTLCLYVDARSFADHLIENLRSPEEGTPGLDPFNEVFGAQFYLPGELQGPELSCPDGYILGKLEPQHTQYVTSRWQYRTANSNLFMNGIIKTCITAAIFDSQDCINPVAWVIEYPCGEIGHLYTVEEHRHRGLATVLIREMCKKVMARGDLPLLVTTHDNPTYRLLKKLGFLELAPYEEYYIR